MPRNTFIPHDNMAISHDNMFIICKFIIDKIKNKKIKLKKSGRKFYNTIIFKKESSIHFYIEHNINSILLSFRQNNCNDYFQVLMDNNTIISDCVIAQITTSEKFINNKFRLPTIQQLINLVR